MKLELSDISYTETGFSLHIPKLEVADGEFFTLLGPSGCGKSTTLRLIAGLLEGAEGTISLNGREVQNLQPDTRNIGMVFQDLALFPHYNVEGNIGYGLRKKQWSRKEKQQLIQDLLKTISLESYGKRHVHTLSGGEQQRVAIARSLAVKPGLLLLDEPLSALDAHMRTSLRREIRRIHREVGFTCIYVTHDQEEAMGLSDRIGIMFDGRIVQTGYPEEIFEHPKNPRIASFTGYTNSFPGKDDGTVIFARPDACILGKELREPDDECIHISGTVKFSEYAGDGYRCGVDTSAGVLEGRSKQKFAPGEACILSIPRDKTVRFEK